MFSALHEILSAMQMVWTLVTECKAMFEAQTKLGFVNISTNKHKDTVPLKQRYIPFKLKFLCIMYNQRVSQRLILRKKTFMKNDG